MVLTQLNSEIKVQFDNSGSGCTPSVLASPRKGPKRVRVIFDAGSMSLATQMVVMGKGSMPGGRLIRLFRSALPEFWPHREAIFLPPTGKEVANGHST